MITAEFDDLLFPDIWSKYDIDTIPHVFTYSNKIRVSVTYLITITFNNNRKNVIRWDFLSYFYWNREIKYPWNSLELPNGEIRYPQNILFF